MESFSRNFYGLLRLVVDGKLTSNFKGWEICDSKGFTIAHFAAMMGLLPDGFERYEIADHSGWTVAHEAAVHGHLPDDFQQWSLVDEDGVSVSQCVPPILSAGPHEGGMSVHDLFEDDFESEEEYASELIDPIRADSFRFLP
jgi:hypothetical protein